jgi:hypothetical protein
MRPDRASHQCLALATRERLHDRRTRPRNPSFVEGVQPNNQIHEKANVIVHVASESDARMRPKLAGRSNIDVEYPVRCRRNVVKPPNITKDLDSLVYFSEACLERGGRGKLPPLPSPVKPAACSPRRDFPAPFRARVQSSRTEENSSFVVHVGDHSSSQQRRLLVHPRAPMAPVQGRAVSATDRLPIREATHIEAIISRRSPKIRAKDNSASFENGLSDAQEHPKLQDDTNEEKWMGLLVRICFCLVLSVVYTATSMQ